MSYWLINKRTHMVLDLGPGDFWRHHQEQSKVFGKFNSPELHQALVTDFQDAYVGNLDDLSRWIDGVIERVQTFTDGTDETDLVFASNETGWRMNGWPIVFHTDSRFWPEEHCPNCLQVINVASMNDSIQHTRFCTNPNVRSDQKWGHWMTEDES